MKNADEIRVANIPLEQQISLCSTYELLQQAAKNYTDKTALIFLPEGKPLDNAPTMSYQELLFSVNQIANLLYKKFHVTAQTTVSFILPNIPQAYALLIAAETTGIAQPIAPMLPPEQIARLLELANSEILITMSEERNPFWQATLAARDIYQKKTGKKLKLLVINGKADEKNAIYDFNALVAEQPADILLNDRIISKHDVCAYFHTSGTTGLPKISKLTHWGKLHMAWAIKHCYQYNEKDVVLGGMPIFHVAAGTVTGNAAFMSGASVVIMSPMGWFEPNVTQYFWQIVEKYKGTLTAAMPFTYKALLDIPLNNADIKSFRLGISGTALPPEELENFEKKTSAKISEIYGLTESSCMVTYNPIVGERHVGSMGIPLPYIQTKVIDGDLYLKGPNIAEYLQPAINKAAFVDGWLNTGDIVTQDETGYFWMVCRKAEAIYRKGEFVSPLEIEYALLRHPKIALAAVLGQPESAEGEVPIAMVTTKSGESISENELKNWLSTQITDSTHLPTSIYVVKDLPQNGMGKVLKNILRYQLIQQIFTATLAKISDQCVFKVNVNYDEQYGTLAKIDVTSAEEIDEKEIEKKINNALDGFNVAYEINCAHQYP